MPTETLTEKSGGTRQSVKALLDMAPQQPRTNEHSTKMAFPFTNLPTEIQTQVIDNLNLGDLHRIKATSRYLRNLVTRKQWRKEIRCTEHVVGFAWKNSEREKGLPTILDYSSEDVRRIANSLPCFDCGMIRPLARFGMFMLGRDRHDLNECLGVLSGRIKSCAEGQDDGPWLGLIERCFDCVVARPEYVGSSTAAHFSGPRGQEKESGTATLHGRWIETLDAVSLLCIGCNELKTYRGVIKGLYGMDIKLRQPSVRQVNEDLCHECWDRRHSEWLDAKVRLADRLQELKAEVAVLERYEGWIDRVDTKNANGSCWVLTATSPRDVRSCLADEPKRGYLVEGFPDWSGDLLSSAAISGGSR